MSDPDDDALEHLRAELEEAADGLTAWLRSLTDIRVAVLVDVVGAGELGAYELAKAEAARLLAWPGLVRAILDANEPETLPGGVVRVGVLVGVTTLDPAAAVRGACATFADRQWTEPRALTIPEHQCASWSADPPPARGPVRVEVHAGPGLATVTERQRRELLDDPEPPAP